jgi:hypothetical protein
MGSVDRIAAMIGVIADAVRISVCGFRIRNDSPIGETDVATCERHPVRGLACQNGTAR